MLAARGNLVHVYHMAGRRTESLAVFGQILAGREQEPGPGTPLTKAIRDDYAVTSQLPGLDPDVGRGLQRYKPSVADPAVQLPASASRPFQMSSTSVSRITTAMSCLQLHRRGGPRIEGAHSTTPAERRPAC